MPLAQRVIELGSYVRGALGTSKNYLLPSLVLDPAANLGIVTNEQFGPSLPIIGYDSEADAVAQANDTWSDCAHRSGRATSVTAARSPRSFAPA